MTRIPWLSPAELKPLSDDYTTRVNLEIRNVLRYVARNATAPITVDDLASITRLWRDAVDNNLMGRLESAYWHSVNVVQLQVTQHAATNRSQTAAAHEQPKLNPNTAGPEIPDALLKEFDFTVERVSNPLAEAYLGTRESMLSNIGHMVWENTRTQLLDALTNGASVDDTRNTIASSGQFSADQAEVIARTELNGAANAGAMAEMNAINVPATKVWMTAIDSRTRPEHADADGQEVDMSDTFDVGGESLDRPHDPNASAENVVNCRCTVSFNIPDDYSGPIPSDDGEDSSSNE
jgi:uncharacterized protein with gpF-like domain